MNCNNEQLNFTCGGDQQLLVTLRREGQAFPAELSDDVVLNIVSERAERINVNFQVGDEGKLLAMLPAEKFQQPGSYGVEVVGLLNGTKWRAWRKRCIRYTPDTQPGSPRSSEQQADPYDITIDVGLVQDIIPRRTSELVNDGEDGNDPFAKAGDVAEALKRYAPLASPKFTGYPIYDDSSQDAGLNGYYYLASKNWVRRCIDWLKTQANGIASLVNGKVPTAQIPDLPYIPSNKKGAANGVAGLNGDGKVPVAQSQFALRGNVTAADIDSTALASGFYRIIGQRLGSDILDGDEANGVLIQYSDGYKEQVLMVGRTAGAAAGEQVETYTRRYLPAAGRWTAWHRLDEPAPEYSLDKSGTAIRLLRDGSVVATVTDSNTTYKAMTAAQATAGTSTTGLLISPKVLAGAIEEQVEGLPTTEQVEETAASAVAGILPAEITHAELVALRNAGQLVAGRQYRITDYVTTAGTLQSVAISSAGHPFDIIVTATSPATLSEVAKAAPRDGDNYFQGCNLAAWQLKYCLANDLTRFAWANETSGKGVIYWMRDEYENECPYDFKNLLFRKKIDAFGHYDPSGIDVYCYTFHLHDMITGQDVDASVVSSAKCFGNRISAYYNLSELSASMTLPNIVLLNTSQFTDVVCSDNIFGRNCRNIVVGSHARNNVFGNDCQNNVLGVFARYNTLGGYCCNITLGLQCLYNNVGTGSWNVTIAPYTRQLTLHSAVLYANITGAASPTASDYVRNAEVKGGSYGSASAYGNIAFAVGAAYPQVAYLTRQGEVAVRDWDGPQPEEPQEV